MCPKGREGSTPSDDTKADTRNAEMEEFGRLTVLRRQRVIACGFESRPRHSIVTTVKTNVKKLRETVRDVLLELRNKALFRDLVAKYENIPQYVLRDIFRGDDDPIFAKFNRLTWKKQVLEVNPSDFAPHTREKFNARAFGERLPDNLYVYRDKERTQVQQQLAATRSAGTNEPVIIVKRVDGYDLWEGWHRTMVLLKAGDNGKRPEEWDRVKINAWVGSRAEQSER